MPGLVFKLIVHRQNSPSSHTVWDSSLKMLTQHMRDIATLLGVLKVDVQPDAPIEGRSWEMAFVMCALGFRGTYSGTVKTIETTLIEFGAVPGINHKKKITDNLKTYLDIPNVRIPDLNME